VVLLTVARVDRRFEGGKGQPVRGEELS